MDVRLIPDDWPLAAKLQPLVGAAVARLELASRLDRVLLVPDAMAADDRAWMRLDAGASGRILTLWFHPDQVLNDCPGHGPARPQDRDWELGPPAVESPPPDPDAFSTANAQRFLYQQLMLVADILEGRLDPDAVPTSLVEAFQEAWLATVDGRLQRDRLPHLSAAERRLRFLRLFSRAGVVTPNHWSIFNGLWDGTYADQAAVLGKVRLLPPLGRRRRV